MAKSKVRKNRKKMKPRTFMTRKSAKRYVTRKMLTYLTNHRGDKALSLTIAAAFDKLHG